MSEQGFRGAVAAEEPEADFREQAAQRRTRPVRRKTVLFDFDGTITRIDSSGYCIRKLIMRHPLRMAAAATFLPVGVPMLARDSLDSLAASVFLWIASGGKPPREWLSRLKSAALKTFSNPHRINEPVVQRLFEHLRRGDRVIIVTGSITIVARTICTHLGIHAPILGSRMKPFLSGYIAQRHCVGIKKVQRLEEQEGLHHWDMVYSDSARDLPMMQRAESVVLVNPTRLTLQRVREALPERVNVEVMRT